MYRNGTLLK